jgi:lipid-binding SYLF domain-containing protein
MLNVPARKTSLLVVCLSLLLAACASVKTQEDARATTDAAEATLNRFLRDPDMSWLQKNLHRAKGLMICPKILQAGFIFGGAGGRCVVLARGSSATGWNGPAFYKIGTGSVGLQAGAQASEMVALLMSDKARDSLLSTSFKLGGDVSVAAGPIGAGAGKEILSDVVTFVRSKGLYAGLNFDGSVITVDDDANQAFYGRAVTPVDILIKGTVRSPLGSSLVRAASAGAGAEEKR